MSRLLSVPPRSLGTLLVLAFMVTAFLLFYSSTLRSSTLQSPLFSSPNLNSTCPPRAYANGAWVERAPHTNKAFMSEARDALDFAGLEGCASSCEYNWHLGADVEAQWPRFNSPGLMDWEWQVDENQCHIEPLEGEKVLRHLISDGSWLLLGDSITENHFFSLSCLLYPHVIATPDYVANPNYERVWPQNLFLNPASPLIPSLRPLFPPGFSIESTPLVTFRRVDLLLEPSTIARLHFDAEVHKSIALGAQWNAAFTLFSDERVWTLSPEYYMELFLAPAPLRYGTLVVSTGGHWTTTVLSGLRIESENARGHGINGVLELFGRSMTHWADLVQGRLDEAAKSEWKSARVDTSLKRKIIVRAYAAGHEDCHEKRSPWKTYQPFRWEWFNWKWIGEMNTIFEDIVTNSKYRDIHFLPIDQPALLRPDAHATSDCLHLVSGTGVIEGWTHYIWHYITKEISY